MADELLTPRSNSYFRDPRIRRVLIRYKLIDTYGNILRSRSTGASRSLPTRPPRQDRSNRVHRSDDIPTRLPQRKQAQDDSSIPNKRAGRLPNRRHSVAQEIHNTGQPLPAFRPRRRTQRPTSAYHVSEDFPRRSIHYGRNSKSAKNPPCRVVIKYLGQQPLLEHNDSWFPQQGDEIVVMQQHCGGENLTVFKGYVKPYHTFAFDSRRHQDYRFALSLYINGLISCRVSVCCEFKYKKNSPLGGPSGSFAIQDVLNSKRCETCQFEWIKKQSRKKSKKPNPPKDPPSTQDSRYKKSVVLLPRRKSSTSSQPPQRSSTTPSPLPPSVPAAPATSGRQRSPSSSEDESNQANSHSKPKPPDSSPIIHRTSPVHHDAEEKRPGTADTTISRPKSSKPRKPASLNPLHESHGSISEDASNGKTTPVPGSKTKPIVKAVRTPTDQTSESGSTTPEVNNADKKKSSTLAALAAAATSLTDQTLNLRDESDRSSPVDRRGKSSLQSSKKDQTDNFHPSKPKANQSNSSDTTEDQSSRSSPIGLSKKNKTNGHLRSPSSSSSTKSGPSDDEGLKHTPSKPSNQFLSLKSSSSENTDDDVYKPEKTHERKEVMPEMHRIRSPPRKTSDSSIPETYTYPLRQNLPDEPLPRPTSGKSSTSSNDFLGIKRSTNKPTVRTTEDFENDFFQTNPSRKTLDDDDDDIFRTPAQSTKTNSHDRKNYFDPDDY